ncbi:MAG: DUF4276 family protein [Oscillatoriaceae cyanobacterium Prado104]|jgi:hypothetical protein|nr:DUF4276 family protein [Oscillatoriaceae cyanobacterium Prado104]
MIRLHIIAEGQTEETFIRDFLSEYDPSQLNNIFPGYEEAIGQLVKECEGYESPELINQGKTTAPSKRIIQAIPRYSKISDGLTIVKSIGLDNIRSKCPHFNQWINTLENLQL